jgi:hypothetical protein
MSRAALDHVGVVMRDLATFAADAPLPEPFQSVLNIARPPMIMPRKDA